MLRKILSYLFPINIETVDSAFSGKIELNLHRGKLVLDTAHTNYSYGSLQRILLRGLQQIGTDRVRMMDNILVLGLAGGSVVRSLTEEIRCRGKITGVDIDPEMILLSKRVFHLDEIENLQIICADAYRFAKEDKSRYELIIVDVFQDDKIPPFVLRRSFSNILLQRLTRKGCILFNTICISQEDRLRNEKFIEQSRLLCHVKTMDDVNGTNQLIFLYK
ncbi:spermidine synthase [Capnocytophaga haemolytica]